MAKKKNADVENMTDENEETKGGKALTALIVIVIVLIWLAVFAVLIKLDVGGFGSEVMSPVLKDVPVLNQILPDSSAGNYEGTYNYETVGEAVDRIKELESQLVAANDTKEANETNIKDLTAEVERLKVFEQQQADFAERVAEFDREVVFADEAPDVSEYQTFYEGISPENAEAIYKEVVEQQVYTQKIKDQADIYSRMEPDKAASVFETMTGDLDLLAAILDNMSQSKSALILQEMSAEAAAQISKKMTSK